MNHQFMKRTVLVAAIAGCMGLCASNALAVTNATWNVAGSPGSNAVSYPWTTAANWVGGVVPQNAGDTADTNVLFSSTLNLVIGNGNNISVLGLSIGSTGSSTRTNSIYNSGDLATSVPLDGSGTGSLTFNSGSVGGDAYLFFGGVPGGPSVPVNGIVGINCPIILASNTDVSANIASTASARDYTIGRNAAASISGAGNFIVNATTPGTVSIVLANTNLSAYTGTFKYTSNGATGNWLGIGAGYGTAGTFDIKQATLDMSVVTAGGRVGIGELSGSVVQFGALTGDGLLGPAGAATTLSVGWKNNTTDTFNGVISDTASGYRISNQGTTTAAFSFDKSGTGTQILGGNNTYSGTTTVNAGALLVNGTHTGGGGYSVASGATLGGTGGIGTSVVTVAAGGFLAPGASIESLDVGGATISGTLAVEYQGAVGAGNDLIDLLNVAGGLDITNATLDLASLGGTVDDSALIFAKYGSLTGTQFAAVTGSLPANYTINYAYNDGASSNNIALVQVPEPCACLLVGVAFVAGGVIRKRRAKA